MYPWGCKETTATQEPGSHRWSSAGKRQEVWGKLDGPWSCQHHADQLGVPDVGGRDILASPSPKLFGFPRLLAGSPTRRTSMCDVAPPGLGVLDPDTELRFEPTTKSTKSHIASLCLRLKAVKSPAIHIVLLFEDIISTILAVYSES